MFLNRGSTRKLGAIVAAAAMSLSVASCASGASSDSGEVTLTYLLHYISKPGDGRAAAVARKFEAAHPNVKINIEDVQPGTEFAKFQTQTTAGNPPDLYLADSTTMATMLANRVLAPVDLGAVGAKSNDDLNSRYLPGALTGYTSDGKIYGLPSEVSAYGAWMNVKAFKDAGLEPPTTWDEVCADGPKMLKKQNGKVVQQELALPTNPPENQLPVLEAIVRGFGGSVFSDDGKTANLTSAPVVEAMTMLQNLVYTCHAAVPSLNGSTTDADRLGFASGQAAMMLTGGSWYLGSLQQAGSDVAPPASRPFPYPAPAGRSPQAISYGYAFVVPAGSKNQQVAWQFAKALADDGIQSFKETGVFNGTKAVAESSVAAQAPFWKTVWEPSLETAHPDVSLVKQAQVAQIIGNAFNAIILNRADVQSTLQATQSKVQPLMNQG